MVRVGHIPQTEYKNAMNVVFHGAPDRRTFALKIATIHRNKIINIKIVSLWHRKNFISRRYNSM